MLIFYTSKVPRAAIRMDHKLGGFKDHPHRKEMYKSKMDIWGGFTNSCEKKRSEKQGRKGKI